jgi:hypothetical protein
MKLTVPKTADQYLEKTEHAVKHAYAGLDSCWAYYRKALQFATPGKLGDNGWIRYLPPSTPEEGARLDRYLELAGKYFDLKISEAMFAGAILEAAYMAIRLFSRNTAIPTSCTSFVHPDQRTVLPFCIGNESHGVPIGLVIYAGRNQYAHWDEESLNPVNKAIFSALNDAFYEHPFADLAFDLGNPTIPIYASEILETALGWITYDAYLAEMKQLLG